MEKGVRAHTHGDRMYFDTGDLSTAEYLYVLRWIKASSETHSAAARPKTSFVS